MSTVTLTRDTIEVSFTAVEKGAGLVHNQSIPRVAVTDAHDLARELSRRSK